MTFFIDCRRCGHTNLRDAKSCAMCHGPLDSGIRDAMNCPVCGSPNGAGSVTCRTCGYNLEKVEQVPTEQRTVVCPYCNAANPPAVQSDAAAYCTGCGREIQLPGSDYSLAEFTPDKAICPSCGKTGIAVGSIHGGPDLALGHLFRPPPMPEALGVDGLSPSAPPVQHHAELDPVGDPTGMAERVWGSEIGAIRSILGTSPPGASAEQIATARRHMTWELWQGAYYCAVDNIVFARWLHSIRRWSPQDFAEEIRTGLPPGAL